MKREELTPIDLECNMGPDVNGVVQREHWKAYDIDEVNLLLDEKDAEIAELKAKLADKDSEIEKLKAIRKVHVEAIASMEAGLHQDGKEIRRMHRALWLARAEWARSSALSYHLIEDHPDKDAAATYKRKANKWEKVKDKCLKKAELYK
jgi:hypothetical protein